MKRAVILLFVVIMVAGVAIEQTPPLPSVDLLGAHNISGRGCIGCHPPATGVLADETNAAASWGSNALPAYDKKIAFRDGGRYVELLTNQISIPDREVKGILVCLSCHDGNVTPPSMMAGQSFEQRIGLLPSLTYTAQGMPTLLGSENYAHDHPVGTAAVIAPSDGLLWANGTFTVIAGSPYAQFIANYGWPVLAPRRSSTPWGINSFGEPFVLCTTCHNQHVMAVYASTASSQIASDGGGKFYPTFFFLNAPYGSTMVGPANTNAGSSTQFCRQCHFSNSNEGNNTYVVPSMVPNY